MISEQSAVNSKWSSQMLIVCYKSHVLTDYCSLITVHCLSVHFTEDDVDASDNCNKVGNHPSAGNFIDDT